MSVEQYETALQQMQRSKLQIRIYTSLEYCADSETGWIVIVRKKLTRYTFWWHFATHPRQETPSSQNCDICCEKMLFLVWSVLHVTKI